MGMLTAYFDGSGNKDSTRVYSVAGYVSTVDRWIDFDRKWSAILKRNSVDYFHMKEFAPSAKHFLDWKGKDEKRAAFLQQLVRIARKYVLYSFSATMSMEVYKKGNDFFPLKENGVVPLLLCGGTCVEKALSWRERKERNEPIKFYFERGEPDWGVLKAWMDKRGLPCEDAPKLPDKSKPLDFPLTPLQAADFVAWEHQKLYNDSVLDGLDRIRGSLKGLMTIPHDWGCEEVRDVIRFAKANGIQPRPKWRQKLLQDQSFIKGI